MTNVRWKLADRSEPQLALFGHLRREIGKGEYRGLEFLEVETKKLITRQPGGPRFGFEYSINSYRGCSHRCTYCFARPTHEYLGLNGGSDFDSKIVVKINAVERATHELAPARWAGHLVAMGTNTDPYQPAEGKYRLTRGILEVMIGYANPTAILTKSSLVLRDLDLLQALTARADVRVDFSVGTLDEEVWKATEPGTPHPRKRIDALAKLRRAGITAGVLMGPILPGLSDRPEQMAEVVEAAIGAGAVSVGCVPLHLRSSVRDHFYRALSDHRPDLVPRCERHFGTSGEAPAEYQDRILGTLQELKAGRLPAKPHGRERPQPAGPVDRQLTLPV